MSKRIDYIVKHNRFPLTKTDWFFLGTIFILITGATVFAITRLNDIKAIIAIILAAVLLGFVIYQGYLSSLFFKKIQTGFTTEQNQKLIVYCMAKLNFKLFNDKEHNNVFVCFVHDNRTNERQEIYLIAKDKYILINSNKEKEAESESGSIDFVDRIGMLIHKTAFEFRQKFKQQNP